MLLPCFGWSVLPIVLSIRAKLHGPLTVSLPPPWAHLSQLPRQADGESAWKWLNQKAVVPHWRELTWEVKMTFMILGSASVL